MTTVFIIFWVAIAIIYDLVAVLVWGSEKTISTKLYGWAKRWPIIPFLIGVTMGHLFWPV